MNIYNCLSRIMIEKILIKKNVKAIVKSFNIKTIIDLIT